MENDAWFFVGIFVFIFILWIAVGGPLHGISFSGPQVPESGSLGGGSTIQAATSSLSAGNTICLAGSTDCGTGAATTSALTLPAANANPNYTFVCLPGSSSCPNSGYSYGTSGNGSSGATTIINPLPAAPEGVTYSPPSPFRNDVSMDDYVSNASSSDPSTEYIRIYVAQNAGGGIDITKWAVESGATYNGAVIPRGTITPTSGVINPTQDIILYPGDSAYIISGKSPIGGSFRVNKCIGYLADFQPFTPSLPDNCPSASDELSAYYGTPYIHDPSCIDYAQSLSRCETAVPPASANLSLTCQNFLENHLSYNGCLATHQSDPDFAGTTWYIYLGLTQSLWRQTHEVVELLDPQGRTVDAFNY
jgi:hypothetical protein